MKSTTPKSLRIIGISCSLIVGIFVIAFIVMDISFDSNSRPTENYNIEIKKFENTNIDSSIVDTAGNHQVLSAEVEKNLVNYASDTTNKSHQPLAPAQALPQISPPTKELSDKSTIISIQEIDSEVGEKIDAHLGIKKNSTQSSMSIAGIISIKDTIIAINKNIIKLHDNYILQKQGKR